MSIEDFIEIADYIDDAINAKIETADDVPRLLKLYTELTYIKDNVDMDPVFGREGDRQLRRGMHRIRKVLKEHSLEDYELLDIEHRSDTQFKRR